MSISLQADGNLADTDNASMLNHPSHLPSLKDFFVLPTMNGWSQCYCVLPLSTDSKEGGHERVRWNESLKGWARRR